MAAAMRRLKWTLVIGVWAMFIVVSFALMERSDYGGGDFHLYYHAVQDYMPEQMPYFTVTGDMFGSLNYPPLLAQALIPLVAVFNIEWATRIWYAISLLALLALLGALSRYLPPKRRFVYWLAAAGFVPVFEALRIGQVNVLLLVMIGFTWIAVKEDRPVIAGVLLAVAAWIKIYPAFLIVYFLLTRNWRVVRAAIIAGLTLALVQIAISGIDVFIEFFRSFVILAGQGESYHMWKNNSIYGFASKLFQPNMRVEPLVVSSTLFSLTRWGLSALVLGVFLLLTLRPKARADDCFDLEYALAVLTMLLLSPWMYTDSVSPVLITFFILWYRGSGQRITLGLLVAGTLLVANYLLMWQPNETFNGALLSLGFYALALLWLINVALLVRQPKQDTVKTATRELAA